MSDETSCLDTAGLARRWGRPENYIRRNRDRLCPYFRLGRGLKAKALYRLEDVLAFEREHMAHAIADEIARDPVARRDAEAVARAAKSSAAKPRTARPQGAARLAKALEHLCDALPTLDSNTAEAIRLAFERAGSTPSVTTTAPRPVATRRQKRADHSAPNP